MPEYDTHKVTPMKYTRTQDVPVKLIGEDSTVFNIIGRVKQALHSAGFKAEAMDYQIKALRCQDYDEVLRLTSETVEIV